MINHVKPPKSPCAHKSYELTCEDYDHLVEHAGNTCQICGVTAAHTKHGFLVIDHDANVGRWAVRGLLCNDCNSALPCGTSPSWARAYLADPWWQRVGLDRAVATRAEQAAEAEQALAAVASATAAFREARTVLETALLRALRAPGAKPSQIAEASPWTAAHVRKFARENGVQATGRYAPPAE